MRKRVKHLTNLLRFKHGALVPTIGPLKTEWEVINVCNSKCNTCLHWKRKPDSTILTTFEGKELIRQLADIGLLNLCFSGGEPLLRKDLVELIDYAKKQALSTSLISNGLLLTERRAIELVDARLDTIYISIDAANATLNDEIRGLKGYFDLAMAAIDNLKAMRRNAAPKIIIKATLTIKNANQLVALAELCVNKGIDGLSFQLAQVLEHSDFIFDDSLLITKNYSSLLLENLDKVITDYKEILTGSLEYYQALRNFIEKPEAWRNCRTVSGFSFAVIDPWGNVFTSPSKISKIGNIREDTFENIWFGQKANEMRKSKANKTEPSYLFEAIGNMSISFSDMSLKRFIKLLRPIFVGTEFF